MLVQVTTNTGHRFTFHCGVFKYYQLCATNAVKSVSILQYNSYEKSRLEKDCF